MRVNVSIQIYDILGRKVKDLLDEKQGPGTLSITWDGKDDSMKPVESGIYLLRFRAGTFIEDSTMVLIKQAELR